MDGNRVSFLLTAVLLSGTCATAPAPVAGSPSAVSTSIAAVSVPTSEAAPDCEDGSSPPDEEEWKASPYFAQMKAQVAGHWKPAEIFRRHDPAGARFGKQDRYIEVRVRLRKSGTLADVSIARSSGLDWLDESAVEALKSTQPFRHPPCRLVKPSGWADFIFGFFVDVPALLAKPAPAGSD